MTKWLRVIADVLWPRGLKCMCCDALSNGEPLCDTCRKGLKAMQLPAEEAGNDRVRSVFRYDGVAKELVLLLKHDCLADAAAVLAEDMVKAMQRMALPPDTVLTWVTMPEIRRKERGIDHGRKLCEAVGEISGFPVRKLLSRTGKVHTQRGLSKELRLRNLTGTLACTEKVTTPVLLIDDVMTTGATASACAEALMAAGAPQVYALTATKAMLGNAWKNDIRKADIYGFYPS